MSKLYDILGLLGMNGKKMSKRKKLIDYAWQRCVKKSPIILDKLLTLGGVFTDLRILTIVIIYNYDTAKKLYPILKEETFAQIDRDILEGTDNELDNLDLGLLDKEPDVEMETPLEETSSSLGDMTAGGREDEEDYPVSIITGEDEMVSVDDFITEEEEEEA